MSGKYEEGRSSAARVAVALRLAVAPKDYKLNSQLGHALQAYDLIFPELTEYRCGWFRTARFHADSVDLWFDTTDGDVRRVERMVNHLDVLEDYPRGADDGMYEPAQANALGEVLAFSWPLWAKLAYGVEIRCGISYDQDETEGPDPATVTFWSIPTTQ